MSIAYLNPRECVSGLPRNPQLGTKQSQQELSATATKQLDQVSSSHTHCRSLGGITVPTGAPARRINIDSTNLSGLPYTRTPATPSCTVRPNRTPTPSQLMLLPGNMLDTNGHDYTRAASTKSMNVALLPGSALQCATVRSMQPGAYKEQKPVPS